MIRSPRDRTVTIYRRQPEVSLSRSLVCTTLVVAAACTSNPTPATSTGPVAIDWTQTGIASWYGHPFHGRRTANGEVYDMDLMTAAHKTLPFDTRVRVENLDNGRVTEVRVNDRGPFVDDRIIDLSRAAATEIDMISSGTAPVRVVVIGMPSTCRLVQVGAFRDEANARERAAELEANGHRVRLEPGPDDVIRVVIGPYDGQAEAERVRARYDGVIQPC